MDNPLTPDYAYWFEVFLTAAGASSIVVALAALLERLCRQPVWQRMIWQTATVALAVLALGQWLGFGPATIGLLRLALAPAVENMVEGASSETSAQSASAPHGSAAAVPPASASEPVLSADATVELESDLLVAELAAGAPAIPMDRSPENGVRWPAVVWGLGSALVLLLILRSP